MGACRTVFIRGPRKGQPATGTTRGAKLHRLAGEQVCDACKEAVNAKARVNDRQRRQAAGASPMIDGHHSAQTRARLASYTGSRAAGYRHGWAATPTYISWAAMKNRCDSPANASYQYYGGRGITYEPRWVDFVAFLADMGERPSLDHSIDRIDGTGNYVPGNVRWATREEQNANRCRRCR